MEHVPPSEVEGIVIQKLRMCAASCNFKTFCGNPVVKNLKQKTLDDLTEYFKKDPVIAETIYAEVIRAIAANLFRRLPINDWSIEPELGLGLQQLLLEDSVWEMGMVYDLFLSFIKSANFQPSIGEKYINVKFIHQTLHLFGSEDHRERDYLIQVLLNIFKTFPGYRSFILKEALDLLLTFVYEKRRFNGVNEVIQLFGNVLDFVSLRDKCKLQLLKTLLLLHKMETLALYFGNLDDCVARLVEKDLSLANTVVTGLLKFWPKPGDRRQLLFFLELQNMISLMSFADIKKLRESIFRQVSRSLTSPHDDVATRALQFCGSERIIQLIQDEPHVVLPLIYPALHNLIADLGREQLRHNAQLFHNTLSQNHTQLMHELGLSYHAERERDKEREKYREEVWKTLEVAPTSINWKISQQ